MKSPLSVDKQTVKKYGITEETDVSPVAKIGYLQQQLQEIQNQQWRSRVDIIHATRLSESDNEILKNKGLQQIGTHLNEVQQFTEAIVMLRTMIDELREEYQELKIED